MIPLWTNNSCQSINISDLDTKVALLFSTPLETLLARWLPKLAYLSTSSILEVKLHCSAAQLKQKWYTRMNKFCRIWREQAENRLIWWCFILSPVAPLVLQYQCMQLDDQTFTKTILHQLYQLTRTLLKILTRSTFKQECTSPPSSWFKITPGVFAIFISYVNS